MTWVFVQRTGALYHDDRIACIGYSGHAEGRNCPEMQSVHCVGPIPAGVWEFRGPPTDSQTHGPYVLRLVPHDGTETFERTGFLLHGDSLRRPGTASLGCIIVPRKVREQVWESGDRALLVVAEESQAKQFTAPQGVA